MLKSLVEKIKKHITESPSVAPSNFNDPVASKTEWTPAKSGGASFRTHTLVRVNSDRIEFRASIGARLFYLIFLLSGLGVIVFMISRGISSGGFASGQEILIPSLVGTIFTISGGCMMYFGTAPIVFDKTRGFFWKGRLDPSKIIDRNKPRHFAKIGDLHALQIISEYCRSDKSSYYSYELNLVLTDASRINVIDHGNLDRIRENGRTLSIFLEKPVWDVTLAK